MKRLVAIGIGCLAAVCVIAAVPKLVSAPAQQSVTAEAIEQASLYVTQDDEGNYLGPTDFVTEGREVTFLNTAANTVYTYTYDPLKNEIVLKEKIALNDLDIYGVKIDRYDGEIYVLGNTFTVSKIDKHGNATELYNLSDALGDALHLYNGPDLASVSEFQVTDDGIQVSPLLLDSVSQQYDPAQSQTCFFPLDASKLSENTVQIVEADLASDGTFYTSNIQTEADSLCGHTACIKLQEANGTVLHEIRLESDKLLMGVQYVGTDEDGNYLVKECAYTYDEVNGDQFHDVLLTVDKNDQIISSAAAPNEDDGNVTLRVIDGAVYAVTSGDTGLSLQEIPMTQTE